MKPSRDPENKNENVVETMKTAKPSACQDVPDAEMSELSLGEEHDFSLCDLCGLSVGQYYRYILYVIDEEVYVEGIVVSNDGVSAIIKVTDRYAECFFEILHYNEVRTFFPDFQDDKADGRTEYFCLDVETELNLFSRDPDSDTIMMLQFDEGNNDYSYVPADPFEFRARRAVKRDLIPYFKNKEE